MKLKVLTAAFVAAIPAFAAAHDYKIGDLHIIHPMAFQTAETAKAGGGYLTISNDGDTDDALIGVTGDFPKVMLHKSEEVDGIATMTHVDRIEIPAGEIVELAPGGYHVMFMGLSDPLETGESFPVTLTFDKAGDIEVIFQIEDRTGQIGHSGHE